MRSLKGLLLSLFMFSVVMFTGQSGEGTPEEEAERLRLLEEEKVKNPEAVLAKNKELLADVARLKKEKEDAEKKAKDEEIERLKKAEDYKALHEIYEKEKADRIASDKVRDEQIAKGAKLASVKDELTKLGINPDRLTVAMRLIDVSSVKFDSDLKLVTGGDVEASRIKMLMPEMFSVRDPENMGDGEGGANNAPGKLTVDAYLKLPKDKQRELYCQMIKDTTGVTVKPKKRF